MKVDKHRYVGLIGGLLFFLFWLVSPAYADGIHVVRPGEDLWRIALQYGTSVTAIMQANGLRNPDWVYVGQRLRIPTVTSSPSSPSSAASPLSSSAAEGGWYVVRPGDTVFRIALRFGVSPTALMQANGIRDARWLWVGQRLRIPTQRARSSTQAVVPPPSGQRVHVVAPGETLFGIAMRYGVSVERLAQVNGLSSTSYVLTGQRLVIPTAGGENEAHTSTSRAVAAPTAGKWIDIDVTHQRLTAYEGDRPVFSALVSTGLWATPTILGRFRIRSKLPAQRMIGPGYDLPNVPWVMYFYETYAIHGAYWHNNFGHPMSHGCVNMRPADAQWLYNWAPIGTPVVVHR